MTYTGPPFGWKVPPGYTFDNLARCSSCAAEIAWCLTPKGNRAPLNPDGVSHFATCPNADLHRKPKAKPPPDPEEEAKQEGMDAAAGATLDWQFAAREWVMSQPVGEMVMSDDVTWAIGVPPSKGAVGALFSGLARQKHIQRAGMGRSRRSGRHKSSVAVWRRT